MSFSKKTAARKPVTKAMPRPKAINPVEQVRTNTEDLAVAQLRKTEAKRIARKDHGKSGTFSPKNNAKFQ